jgi:hypothetical protein
MIVSLKRLGTVENDWLFLEPIGLRWCEYRHLFSRDKAAENELTGGIWRTIEAWRAHAPRTALRSTSY